MKEIKDIKENIDPVTNLASITGFVKRLKVYLKKRWVKPEKILEDITEDASEGLSEEVSGDTSEDITEDTSEGLSEEVPEYITEDTSGGLSEEEPENITEDASESLSEEVSEDISDLTRVSCELFIAEEQSYFEELFNEAKENNMNYYLIPEHRLLNKTTWDILGKLIVSLVDHACCFEAEMIGIKIYIEKNENIMEDILNPEKITTLEHSKDENEMYESMAKATAELWISDESKYILECCYRIESSIEDDYFDIPREKLLARKTWKVIGELLIQFEYARKFEVLEDNNVLRIWPQLIDNNEKTNYIDEGLINNKDHLEDIAVSKPCRSTIIPSYDLQTTKDIYDPGENMPLDEWIDKYHSYLISDIQEFMHDGSYEYTLPDFILKLDMKNWSIIGERLKENLIVNYKIAENQMILRLV